MVDKRCVVRENTETQGERFDALMKAQQRKKRPGILYGSHSVRYPVRVRFGLHVSPKSPKTRTARSEIKKLTKLPSVS
jgi:hypothetical protein